MGKSHNQASSYASPSKKVIYRALTTPSNVTMRNSGSRKHSVSFSELDERLFLWIRQCEDYKLPVITGATIQPKAATIRCDLVRSGNSKDTVSLQALMLSGMGIEHSEASRSDVDAVAWRGGICISERSGEWKDSNIRDYTGL